MKKIILTLSITIMVFVITLLITNEYISNKSTETADKIIMHKMDNLCSEFDGDMLLTKNSVYGFLTGNFLKYSGDKDGYFYVGETYPDFYSDKLETCISNFLKANPYYNSAMFILEKDSTPPLTKHSYYAPFVPQKTHKLKDLATIYDYSQSENLKKCKKTRKPFWSVPSKKSGFSTKLVIFYVPILDKKDGKFIGAFSVSLNISTIDKKIEKNLPYKNNASEMLVLNDNNEVIASYPINYDTAPSYALISDSARNKANIISIDTAKNRKEFIYEGKEYVQYERTLKYAPWKINATCCSSAVYADANNIENVVMLTSLIGMLLMLISCTVISMQIYRTYHKKTIAEQELNMASKVQMALLRKKSNKGLLTSLHTFIQPAREAGGDLYDYAEKEGKLIFCIGDVSGKGMPAALFMTQVVSLFRSTIKHTTDPARIVSSINAVLSENNPDMTFCTLFVGSIEGTDFTFCNAGHNLPVMLPCMPQSQKATDTISDASPAFLNVQSNIAIGIMPGFPYTSEKTSLHDGESILLYTDGVTEAKNKKHKLYGEERMLQALSARNSNAPETCTNLLVSGVKSFVNGAEQSDDITILCINKIDS